jgi:hypothetical protein
MKQNAVTRFIKELGQQATCHSVRRVAGLEQAPFVWKISFLFDILTDITSFKDFKVQVRRPVS